VDLVGNLPLKKVNLLKLLSQLMRWNQTLEHGRKISKDTTTRSLTGPLQWDLISLSLVLITLMESQSMLIH
jgi:hypothetical protein